MILLWNEWNIFHIAKHGVRPEEVNYVVKHARRPYPMQVGDGKVVVRGRTQAGRYIQVIFSYPSDNELDWDAMDLVDRMKYLDGDKDVVYVIHARDLTAQVKRRLNRKRQ